MTTESEQAVTATNEPTGTNEATGSSGLMIALKWLIFLATLPLRIPLFFLMPRVSKDGNEVKVTSLHSLFFAFPLLLLSWATDLGWIPLEQSGEWFFWTLLAVLIMAFTDLDAIKSAILIACVGFVVLLGQNLELFLIKDLSNYLIGDALGSASELIERSGRFTMWVLLLFVFPYAVFFCRYTISTRYVQRHILFRGTTSVRIGRKPNIIIPDILEFLFLAGGGSVGSGRSSAIRNIFGLYFVKPKVENIFQRFAIAAEEDDADDDEL